MDLLFDLTVVFALAAIVLFISTRLKIPSIVGLLLSGFLVGPYGLRLVTVAEEVEVMAEIGVLLLLFTIGMEFSLEKLMKSKLWIIIGGGFQVLITTTLVFLGCQILGIDRISSLFIGFLFSMSSTAIVLHILQERGWMDRPFGKSSLAVLIFQDIIIIPLMLFIPLLVGEGEGRLEIIFKIAKGFTIVVLVVLLARKIVPKILAHIVHSRSQDLFLMTVLVICFATAFITYELGLKLALGAFLAGLIVSESEYCMDALSSILPLKKIFTSLFFISVGMLLNSGFFAQNFFPILGIVSIVLVLKTAVVVAIALILKLSLRDSLITGLSLSQVGEFAFVLSAVGNEYSILSVELYQTFLAVSILSMAISPFIIINAPRYLTKSLPKLYDRFPSILRRFELGRPEEFCQDKGHLLIIGYGPGGQRVALAAKQKGLSYSIVELNRNTVEDYRSEGEPIFAGSATERTVLIKAGADKARTVVITVPQAANAELITTRVREINPSAHIIVRTQYISEVEVLRKLGANEVIPAEQEAAHRIADSVLLQFGS